MSSSIRSAVMVLLGGGERQARRADPEPDPGTVEARGHSGFILLTIGFFVCGFQVQFVATHLPAFVEDQGFGSSFASTALVTIAGFNMVGAWFAGAWVGGAIFDGTGSYEAVWWIAAGLGVLAAMFHVPIDDRPVARLSAAR
jgi:hypothetical protein